MGHVREGAMRLAGGDAGGWGEVVSAKGQGPPGRGRTLGILTSTCPRSRTRLSCCTCVRPPGAAWVEGLEGGPGRTEVAAGDRRRAGTGPRAQGSCFMQGTWGVAGPVHQRSCKANTDHKKSKGKKWNSNTFHP